MIFLDDFYNFTKSSGINLNWIGNQSDSYVVDSKLYYKMVDRINSLPKYEKMEKNLNVLLGHDVEAEINSVFNEFGKFSYDHLSVQSSVDLVIRSGYAHRFSGFLPLSTRYSELVTLNKLFPDVDYEDISRELTTFALSKKNFGK